MSDVSDLRPAVPTGHLSDTQTAPPGVLLPNRTVSTGTLAPTPGELEPPRDPGGPHRHAGPPPAPPEPPRPRRLPTPLRPGDFGAKDVWLLILTAVSSFCLVWVVFYQLTYLSGVLGFLFLWFAAFLALTWITTAQLVDRRVATDRVVAAVVVTAALVMVGIVVFIVAWVAVKAIPTMHWGTLFTHDQKLYDPSDPHALAHVGILQAIIGTFEQMAVAAVIGVPLAIMCAIFLNEVGGWGVRTVRTVVTAMSGTPSVVAGIFIYSLLIIDHVLSYSGFAASLALTVILLPSVTRVVEEVLRIVPSGLREASMALGAPQWRTVWSVVLPTARSGVVTAVLLGVARIVGETAPLIFTAFGSQVINTDPFSHPQGALPLAILQNIRQAQAVSLDLAFQAAFVLIVVVLVLFVAARLFSRPRSRDKGGSRRAKPMEDDFLARLFVPVPMDQPATPADDPTPKER